MTDTTDADPAEPTDQRTQATSPVLATTSLTKEYAGRPIFTDVDLAIDSGAMTAIIGPNGVGKTTLLETLLGHVAPTAGNVAYNGPSADRQMGYLPQEPAFRPQFTVAETIDFYASLVTHTVDTERLLCEVNLQDARDRRVAALSGGLRRLLAVAQAVLGDPPIVCCDEPASGLDPTMARQVFSTLADRADNGMAIVVASHTLSLVEAHADHVVILAEDGVAAGGSPAALIDRFDAADLWDVYTTAVDTAPEASPGAPDRRRANVTARDLTDTSSATDPENKP